MGEPNNFVGKELFAEIILEADEFWKDYKDLMSRFMYEINSIIYWILVKNPQNICEGYVIIIHLI